MRTGGRVVFAKLWLHAVDGCRAVLAVLAGVALLGAVTMAVPAYAAENLGGYLTQPTTVRVGPSSGAKFGWSLAAGDVNADGFADLLVGAPGLSDGQTDEGGVFLYLGSPSGLQRSPAWSFQSNEAGAKLGWSVTLGDFDGDGDADAAIGAPYASPEKSNQGAVYAFLSDGTSLGSTPIWRDLGGAAGDRRGWTVARIAWGPNGADTVMVCSPGYDDPVFNHDNAGQVIAYNNAVDGPSAGLQQNDAGVADGDQRGKTLVELGDMYGDNTDYAAAVDSVGQVTFGSRTNPSGVSWIQNQDTTALAGHGVAPISDVSGDGDVDVIIGIPGHDTDDGQTDAGVFTVVSCNNPADGPVQCLEVDSGANDTAGANLGWSVSSIEDVNDNGFDEVLVGAPGDHSSLTAGGSAAIFEGKPNTLGIHWIASSTQAGTRFSHVVDAADINGDGHQDIVVTAPKQNDQSTDQGAVFTFLWIGQASANCMDADGDGVVGFDEQSCPQGADCDDTRTSVFPGAIELCDEVDNDCDEQVDESCSDPCEPEPESCDGADNDCDGQVDEEGVCASPSSCQTTRDCDGEAICVDRDGASQCVEAPCAGVECGAQSTCYRGVCYPSCSEDVDCSIQFQRCWDGRCATDRCDRVECVDAETCFRGACYPACKGSTKCASGADRCYNGRCAADPCEGVDCKSGQTCYRGACFAKCTDREECADQSRCYEDRCAPTDCAGVTCRSDETCYRGACFPSCRPDAECGSDRGCRQQACVPDDSPLIDDHPARQTGACRGCVTGASGQSAAWMLVVLAVLGLVAAGRRVN